jgi:23S rRNA (uracil1939-C5)-methyltransferase
MTPPDRLRVETPLTIVDPPACKHFGACGGCHYQHARYPEQLAIKRQLLGELLGAAGLKGLPKIQTESAEPFGYRNRIRLRVEAGAAGVELGYSRTASNDFVPIHMCPIAAPGLWNAAKTIGDIAHADPAVGRWLVLTGELELFTTPDESKLQLQFFLRDAVSARRESPRFAAFCERLRGALPNLAGASATLDPDLHRSARKSWAGAAWGAPGLNYPAAGRQYWVPRGTFFQVNRFLVDRLVELVTAGRSGDLAWDLYAGVGLFSRALATSFLHVVAVEAAEPAAASLTVLKENIEPVHAATLDFLRARALQRERPSLVVLDPPRAGIGLEAARILAGLNIPEIVYVSCDPTTLARDLAILVASHEIVSVYLVDLFPQTFHLETVVHLSRSHAESSV